MLLSYINSLSNKLAKCVFSLILATSKISQIFRGQACFQLVHGKISVILRFINNYPLDTFLTHLICKINLKTAKLRKFSVDKNRGQIIFILSTVSAVKRTGDRGQRHTPFRGVCPLLSAATHVRYQRSSQRIYLKRGGLSNLGCLWDAISIGSGANKRTTNVSGHGLGRLRASWGICSPSGETPIGCGIYRGQKPRTNKNAFVHGFYFLGVTTHHSRWPKTTPVRNASSPRAVQLGMVSTSAIRRLAEIVPESETHWRDVAAAAHRAIGGPGSEAAARTHETLSWEIREGLTTGTTRGKLCRPCLSRGYRYLLIWVGGRMRCGTCHQATLSP